MKYKFETGSYVYYEGDRYLVIDRKKENNKNVYRLMGIVFDYIPENELKK